MVSLKEGRGKTVTWVFAVLGFVVGLLAYDLTASSQNLHRADCEELAPVVGDFFEQTEKFIAKNPKKWHRVEVLYEGLYEELESYLPATDVMKKHGDELRSTLEQMARSIYGFNPNARNRERLEKATARTRAQLKALGEVCQ